MCGRHVGLLRDGFCVFAVIITITYHALLKLLVSYNIHGIFLFFSYCFPSVVAPAFSTPAFSASPPQSQLISIDCAALPMKHIRSPGSLCWGLEGPTTWNALPDDVHDPSRSVSDSGETVIQQIFVYSAQLLRCCMKSRYIN